MTHEDAQAMCRQNEYLKRRNAQLQNDITSLSAQVRRTQQELERLSGRHTGQAPNRLAGGQT